MDKTGQILLDRLESRAEMLMMYMQRGLRPAYQQHARFARSAVDEVCLSIQFAENMDALPHEEREEIMQLAKKTLRELDALIDDMRYNGVKSGGEEHETRSRLEPGVRRDF